MSNRTDGRPKVVRIKKKTWRRRIIPYAAVFVAGLITFGALGWLNFPFFQAQADAGPTELRSIPQTTVIESVDFDCKTAVTSVGTYVAYDPGWEIWIAGGGEAGVAFDVVSDFDICLWANDYTAVANQDTGNLEVTVERLDARRPRINHLPWEYDGVTYHTLELSSQGGGMLADANFDRTLFEGVRNFFSGRDTSYMVEMTTQLLGYAQTEILNTACMGDALEMTRLGLQEHFFNEAFQLGLSNVVLTMPPAIDIPDNPGGLDYGDDVVFSRQGSENCHTVDWEATPAG